MEKALREISKTLKGMKHCFIITHPDGKKEKGYTGDKRYLIDVMSNALREGCTFSVRSYKSK